MWSFRPLRGRDFLFSKCLSKAFNASRMNLSHKASSLISSPFSTIYLDCARNLRRLPKKVEPIAAAIGASRKCWDRKPNISEVIANPITQKFQKDLLCMRHCVNVFCRSKKFQVTESSFAKRSLKSSNHCAVIVIRDRKNPSRRNSWGVLYVGPGFTQSRRDRGDSAFSRRNIRK